MVYKCATFAHAMASKIDFVRKNDNLLVPYTRIVFGGIYVRFTQVIGF
jgi:hypothetical protein